MRTTVLVLSCAAVLGGCISRPNDMSAPAVHDFGAPPPVAAPAPVALRRLDIEAAPWLRTPAMQYRRSAPVDTRRLTYADNRWAAPPAQLVQMRLERLLPPEGQTGCKLAVRLDEFVQVFDGADRSQVVVMAQLTLLNARSERALARRPVDIAIPAESHAAGGAKAFAAAVDTLAAQGRSWLAGLDPALCSDPR